MKQTNFIVKDLGGNFLKKTIHYSKEKFRAWLIEGFLFLFSKQYKNNFLKIELETSF